MNYPDRNAYQVSNLIKSAIACRDIYKDRYNSMTYLIETTPGDVDGSWRVRERDTAWKLYLTTVDYIDELTTEYDQKVRGEAEAIGRASRVLPDPIAQKVRAEAIRTADGFDTKPEVWLREVYPKRTLGYMVADGTRVIHETMEQAEEAAATWLLENPYSSKVGIARVEADMEARR